MSTFPSTPRSGDDWADAASGPEDLSNEEGSEGDGSFSGYGDYEGFEDYDEYYQPNSAPQFNSIDFTAEINQPVPGFEEAWDQAKGLLRANLGVYGFSDNARKAWLRTLDDPQSRAVLARVPKRLMSFLGCLPSELVDEDRYNLLISAQMVNVLLDQYDVVNDHLKNDWYDTHSVDNLPDDLDAPPSRPVDAVYIQHMAGASFAWDHRLKVKIPPSFEAQMELLDQSNRDSFSTATSYGTPLHPSSGSWQLGHRGASSSLGSTSSPVPKVHQPPASSAGRSMVPTEINNAVGPGLPSHDTAAPAESASSGTATEEFEGSTYVRVSLDELRSGEGDLGHWFDGAQDTSGPSQKRDLKTVAFFATVVKIGTRWFKEQWDGIGIGSRKTLRRGGSKGYQKASRIGTSSNPGLAISTPSAPTLTRGGPPLTPGPLTPVPGQAARNVDPARLTDLEFTPGGVNRKFGVHWRPLKPIHPGNYPAAGPISPSPASLPSPTSHRGLVPQNARPSASRPSDPDDQEEGTGMSSRGVGSGTTTYYARDEKGKLVELTIQDLAEIVIAANAVSNNSHT